ncbi:LTA synthase family protein [Bifidobacterium favimelis]|uniref:LTA synthase family protein n=1 Tax=Bifidobacterium favimelis TaxID=3122979 RepID=A0ABU8ZM99_9BIFI
MSENEGKKAEAASDGRPPRKGIIGRLKIWSWVYALVFILADFLMVALIQWGVDDSGQGLTLQNFFPTLGGMITSLWTEQSKILILNLVGIALIYAAVVFIFNRFWIATAVMLIVALVVGVIEHFKVVSRHEAVLPADLNFLQADAGNIATFLPAGAGKTIGKAVAFAALLIVVFVLIGLVDRRHGRMVRIGNKAAGASVRLVCILVPTLVVALFMSAVGTYGTWANRLSLQLGDFPSMWDSVLDAKVNGAFVSFSRQLNPKVMEKPKDYNEATMKALAKRYSDQADQINQGRNAYMDESTLVYVLSESFSDPTRVPGLQLNEDPIPEIRGIKDGTTSGLMLSSGYGGGTANLEFQAMTGLSMANFDPSLTSPYQQIVPDLPWIFTANQIWGGPEHSQAFHPYMSSMYSRASNYKKFGFSHFYALHGPDQIAHQDKSGSSPYVNDKSSYDSALEKMGPEEGNQFVGVITMQNHMPYNDWYEDNQFTAAPAQGAPGIPDDELMTIRTYAKGANLTDQATRGFLDSIDKMDKPVTVIFYGDHLPGIYNTAGADSANSLALHLTDYFIWSNSASSSAGRKIENAEYSSPNFFVAQAAEHMNAKISPYLAFLTDLHQKVSAMEPPVVNNIQTWTRIPEGQTIYLDSKGEPMDARSFDARTKALLHDYKLIQYDITAGKQYLRTTGFVRTPTRASDAKKGKAQPSKGQGDVKSTAGPSAPAPSATASQGSERQETTSGQ